MKGIKTESTGAGPTSSAGLMRFFDVTGGGPKIGPMVVVGACIGFILFELILNVLF
jgi:preprotein translocase subunit Sec61beta